MPDLSPTEITALHDLLNDLSPNLALALAEQINREVTLDSPEIEAVPIQELLALPDEVIQTTFSLNQPNPAESLFLFEEATGRLFVDLIEGHEGTEPPASLLDDHLEKLAVAMSGLARGLATSLTNLTGDTVDLESCTTTTGTISLPPVFALDGTAVQIRLELGIPDLHQTYMTFLFTPEFARALLAEPTDSVASDSVGASADQIIPEDELAAMLGSLAADGGLAPTQAAPGLSEGLGGRAAAPGSPFPQFSAAGQENMPRGMDLILDIPLDVTVELGRVRMLIKDVLELASGSIVELDRVAGEPVDMLVNGRLIAKGEVVVIEDNFGIRITEIISPADRVAGLGKGR
jgi:flagellar motor switch protein FliN/FliY